MARVRARVKVKGGLVIVETEEGQKAVVPLESACEFMRDYNLEPEVVEGRLDCPQAPRRARVVEVDAYTEED